MNRSKNACLVIAMLGVFAITTPPAHALTAAEFNAPVHTGFDQRHVVFTVTAQGVGDTGLSGSGPELAGILATGLGLMGLSVAYFGFAPRRNLHKRG